jgi:ribosome-binding protein aMBF1 (putative translation factor)
MTPTEIRSARIAAGMSQQELAVAAGISVAQVSRIETGKVKPHRLTMRSLERVLLITKSTT